MRVNPASTFFTASAALLITLSFAFGLFAVWILFQYGAKTTEFDWQAQRLGDEWFVSNVIAGGSADGSLRNGDRIVAINGERTSGASTLGLMLRSVAGGGLYCVKVDRGAALSGIQDVWLRARAHPDGGFLPARFPLLCASFFFFLAGLAMLVRWDRVPARLGFVAATACSLRMGLCALLPLTGFFQPEELCAYYLFWLPVGLAMPASYHALLAFTDREPPSRAAWTLAGALYVLWGTGGFALPINGSIAAPVAEGVAYVYWNHVQYAPTSGLLSVGFPLLMLVSVAACVVRLLQLLRCYREGDVHRRLKWLLTAGLLFAFPAASFENAKWLGFENSGAVTWMSTLTAICLAYAMATKSVTSPAMVVRGLVSALLPDSWFRKLDRRWYPKEWETEEHLRKAIGRLKTIPAEQDWQPVVAEAIQTAFRPVSFALHDVLRSGEMIEIGDKSSAEPYTQREERLVDEIERQVIALLNDRSRTKAAAAAASPQMNLLRECPKCGTCYDSTAVRCRFDSEMPVLTLPVEQVIDGKYQLERLLGRGGMGSVYAARDRRLDRRVALKIMLSELFGHDGALKRFEREARAAARLSHPNVIQIFDFGPVGTMGAYQVMELVEGRSWRTEIALQGGVPVPVCREWIEQLLDGIEAAHGAGIIHRDLKPDNLFLVDREGGPPLVKILDFGLAKMNLLDLSREEKLSIGVMTIGTVGYVPPEQLTGGPADQRSDIYAIGRIVMETLTGSLPVECPFDPDSPLAEVLARCTAHSPSERPSCIAELRAELLPALECVADAAVANR
ncbi:MAG: protein kinase [Bryobacteraceae bacterium]|nr:protein kinase [Bryobacteraceae bacterium]